VSARTPPIKQVGERGVRTLLNQSIGVDALNLPVGRSRARRAAADRARAVEQPDHNLSGRGIVPEDVALAVAVEIAGSGDGKGAPRRTGRAAADHRAAVQEPDNDLSGRGVVPEDVALAVAIKMAGARARKGAPRRTG